MIRCDVLGVPFDAVTLEEAVKKAMQLMERGLGAQSAAAMSRRVVTPNPEIVWLCHTDPVVMEAVASADLILADGVGVTRAARKLGRPLPCRVTGADWLNAMLTICAENGKRIFLLGGKPGVAGMAARDHSSVCGTHDGYFQDDGPVLQAIKDAKPDFLAVCLGAPKQELWMYHNREALSGILTAGLGGSLDVLAGTVKRAPRFIQRIGFEWLYRVIREPKRFKRLIVIPKFLYAVSKQKKQEKKNG